MIVRTSRTDIPPVQGSRVPGFSRTEKAGELFDRFFNLSGDLLCIFGADGYIKRLNPAWTAVLGWSEEELSSIPFIEFVHADDRASTLAKALALNKTKGTVRFENRYRHKDASYRCLQWKARAVPANRCIYAAARDVTQQQRQEREILSIADREKECVGRNLHDSLCQSLAGVAALSSALSKKLSQTAAADLSADASNISRLLSDIIGDARDIARGLDTSSLDAAGLDAALRTLAVNVEHLFRVTCTLDAERAFPRLAREVEGHLFRIAQEAVHNAISHGRAHRIEISLARRNDAGLLAIRDDGVGLPDTARRSDGLGLHTMAYRARNIGASLDLRRRSVRGTAVTCRFPLVTRSDANNESDERQRSPGEVTRQ